MVRVSVPCTGRASRMMPAPTRQHRRDQRPPEARHLPRPERQRQPGDAADQKHPAQENGDGEARQRRHDHRRQPQDRPAGCLRTERPSNAREPRRSFWIADLVMSWGRVIGNLPIPARRTMTQYDARNVIRRQRRQVCSQVRRRRHRQILALTGRRRKTLRRVAHPVAAENVDRGGDHQQRDADQDRSEADRDQNQRRGCVRD